VRSRATAVFLSFILSLFVAGSGFGQGTDLGTIRGTITDASGAVVAEAKVTVTDVLTNTNRVTETNSDGSYQVFGLRPGTYELTIEAPGMSKSEIHGVVLNGSDLVTTDAVLKVSSATQTSVIVTVEAPTINTEDQTISQNTEQ
jgi:carboxypeptidase family protein